MVINKIKSGLILSVVVCECLAHTEADSKHLLSNFMTIQYLPVFHDILELIQLVLLQQEAIDGLRCWYKCYNYDLGWDGENRSLILLLQEGDE